MFTHLLTLFTLYLYSDPWPPEDGDLLVPVGGDEPEDLVAVLVPLDGVELLVLQVVEALEHGAVALELVARNAQTDQTDAEGACKGEEDYYEMLIPRLSAAQFSPSPSANFFSLAGT